MLTPFIEVDYEYSPNVKINADFYDYGWDPTVGVRKIFELTLSYLDNKFTISSTTNLITVTLLKVDATSYTLEALPEGTYRTTGSISLPLYANLEISVKYLYQNEEYEVLFGRDIILSNLTLQPITKELVLNLTAVWGNGKLEAGELFSKSANHDEETDFYQTAAGKRTYSWNSTTVTPGTDILNQTYQKYYKSNGLLVCYGVDVIPFYANANIGTHVEIPFIQKFKTPPICIASQEFDDVNIRPGTGNGGVTTDRVTFSMKSAGSTTVQYRAFSWIAIGTAYERYNIE